MAVIELFTNATFAVRLSPPISAQSRLQSRPNLGCNLASQDDPLSLMIRGGPDYSKRENGFDGSRAFVTHLQTALSDELYWSLNVSEVM